MEWNRIGMEWRVSWHRIDIQQQQIEEWGWNESASMANGDTTPSARSRDAETD